MLPVETFITHFLGLPLRLDDNPLQVVLPSETVEQGTQAVIKYFQQRGQ